MQDEEHFFNVFKTYAEIEAVPLFLLSGTFSVISCNDYAAEFLKKDIEQIQNKRFFDLFHGGQIYEEVFKGIVSTSKARKIRDVCLTEKSEASYEMVVFSSGSGAVVLIKELAGSAREDAKALHRKKMFENLIASICNNFNNVLGAIEGTSSVIRMSLENLKEKALLEELKGNLDIIDKSVGRGEEMVGQLQSFSEKVKIQYAEMDLNDIIRNVYIKYLSKLDKSITVDVEILSGKAVARIDTTLVESSLIDICENAVHSMTVMREDNSIKGGILRLSVDKVETDKSYRISHPKAVRSSYWLVTISDTGIGIKKELQKKIFDPFYSIGKHGLNPDGLGLAIANNVIQEHGGFIEMESEPEKGSSFYIFIPEYKYNDMRLTPGVSVLSVEEVNQSVQKANHVLVVDDDIIMRRVAEIVLEKLGYKVLMASDGDEAVNIYRDRSMDIACALLDNSMPKMSGIEAYYEMKKINPFIKALIVSGYDKSSEEVQEALKNGMNGFVKKPYTMADLSKTVKELLR